MTDQERKAMQMALEALENCAVSIDSEWGDCRSIEEMRETGEYTRTTTKAIEALRQALAQTEQEPHQCELNSPYQAYGNAIDDCHEDDEGRFWAGNGEYGSQVNYCPVCGMKAPKQVDGDKHD